MSAAGVCGRAFGVVVKNEAEYTKRKTLDSAQAKVALNKKARTDENAQQGTLLEALERELPSAGTVRCPAPLAPALAPAAQHPQAGPTDFSGLFPRSGAQQQQQPSAFAAPQQEARPAIRTFEDLAAQRQPGRQVLGSLPLAMDYLQGALPQAAGEASNLTTAAAGAGSDSRDLPPSDTAPVDWSLKTVVRFSSPTPFTIAEEAACLSGRDSVAAQRAFASCEAGLHRLSMQQRLAAALHSWQYPQDPWRAPAAGATKLRGPQAGQLMRRRDWQAAFCSLFDALRCGACDTFYYVSPEGSKKPFAVLFGAAGIGGRMRVHALLTRSTAGLRALLTGGMGLGFAAPLLPADADRRMELDKSAVPLDGSQSLLVFEGAVRVQGLFDFLLNESFRSHGDECDVPLLLAPCQFAHAAMTAVQPKVLGVSDARDPSRAQHRLELRASALPPWVVDRVGAVLAATQDGSFSMACDTHALTLALNWCPKSGSSSSGGVGSGAATLGRAAGGRRSGRRQPLGGVSALVDGCSRDAEAAGEPAALLAQLTDYEARLRGCWDAEEAARWRAAVPGLSCNVLRELRCEGGRFVARLSAKSAERVVL